MGEADFAYPERADSPVIQPVVLAYSGRKRIMDEWCEDAAAAGIDLRDCGPLARHDSTVAGLPGYVVMVDCPQAGAAELAALSLLDMQAVRGGASVLVSTSLDALEPVFGCLSQSQPRIMIEPLRAEWVIALGQALVEQRDLSLRELSETDRMALLRLTEQVAQLGEKLERLETGRPGQGGDAGLATDRPALALRSPALGDRLVRATRPPLPDAKLVRKIIQQRQLRARFFESDLFADPAWDMLLDLTAARVEHARVSVTSLCIASGVPPTTALRWIGQLTAAGLFERVEDDTDRRRAFIQLTDKAVEAMSRYFHELGQDAARLV